MIGLRNIFHANKVKGGNFISWNIKKKKENLCPKTRGGHEYIMNYHKSVLECDFSLVFRLESTEFHF